jgi:predicted nuclease of predicted toxin-antitoxin system
VKILLDECVDWRLARDLVGHDVKTARQMGWTAIKNGELLALASAEFDLFVTVDRNLSFRRNLPSLALAVVILRAKSNRLAELKPLALKLLTIIPTARRGAVAFVDADEDVGSTD